MKLLAAIKHTLVLLAVVLLNSLACWAYHCDEYNVARDGWDEHGSSDITSCATLCRTAVINKEDNLINDDGKAMMIVSQQHHSIYRTSH